MRSFYLLFAAVFAGVQVQARAFNDRSQELWVRESTTQAPTCAVSLLSLTTPKPNNKLTYVQLECLATLIPQYCGSLTNNTCICTSLPLSTALTPCVLATCNTTDALLLQRYSAITCNIPNDKTRRNQQFQMYYVLPPLVFLFVGMRVCSRVMLEIGLGADDWMVGAAAGAYFVDVGTGLGIVVNGFGEHTFVCIFHFLSSENWRVLRWW